jgi:hypothetical protein
MRITTLPLLVLVAACATDATIDDPTFDPGGEDPWTALERDQREGPPRYTSRVHSCAKMRVATLGHLLESRGVNLDATDELSAGFIYRGSTVALGGPKYTDRVRETLELGIATASKLFDIYVQAAPELIASMPTKAACMKFGAPAQLFDVNNKCLASGFSCLMGLPASPEHLAICNETVKRAADVASGKRMAVALLAAAAHTCE